jgi:hypothetical protein
MREIIRILRVGTLRFALLAVMSVFTHAQSTVHIDFGQLPPGAVLESQYSNLGIHFGTNWGTEATFNTVVSSAPQNQISGGPFVEVAASVLPMTFDQLVSSISAEVALVPQGGNQYPANLQFIYNNPGAGGEVGGGFVSFQDNNWRSVTFDAPKPTDEIDFASPVATYYVRSMDISFIPEPPASMLLAAAGVLIVVAQMKFRRKARTP